MGGRHCEGGPQGHIGVMMGVAVAPAYGTAINSQFTQSHSHLSLGPSVIPHQHVLARAEYAKLHSAALTVECGKSRGDTGKYKWAWHALPHQMVNLCLNIGMQCGMELDPKTRAHGPTWAPSCPMPGWCMDVWHRCP